MSLEGYEPNQGISDSLFLDLTHSRCDSILDVTLCLSGGRWTWPTVDVIPSSTSSISSQRCHHHVLPCLPNSSCRITSVHETSIVGLLLGQRRRHWSNITPPYWSTSRALWLYNSVMRTRKAATARMKSEQVPRFGFALQNCQSISTCSVPPCPYPRYHKI